jgi:hypothetical protein
MTAAFIVAVHQTTVQFCCNGVTGAIKADKGEGWEDNMSRS